MGAYGLGVSVIASTDYPSLPKQGGCPYQDGYSVLMLTDILSL